MIKVIYVWHGIFEKHWRIGRRKKINYSTTANTFHAFMYFLLILFLLIFLYGSDGIASTTIFIHDYFLFKMISKASVLWMLLLNYGCYYYYLSFAIINNLIHKAFPNLGFFSSLSNRIIGAKHPGILTFFWSITQNCFVKGSNWLIYPQPFMKLQWAYLFLKTASCFFDYWWIWMFSSLLSGCILGCFSKIQIWSFAFLLRNPPCPYCAYTLDKVLWSIMGVSTCEHTCDTNVNSHLNQRHIF